MALIIVESPTKARTFNYILKSKNAKEDIKITTLSLPRWAIYAICQKAKLLSTMNMILSLTWNRFLNKEKVITQLKNLATENQEIILATDQDREGEAISYHIAYILGYINEDWPNIGFKEGVPSKELFFMR